MSPRRIYRRPTQMPSLDPATFVRRLATKAGTRYGWQLVGNALRIAEDTGDVDPWIQEVRRGREAGSISDAAAYFLIFKLGEAALVSLSIADETLRDIAQRMDMIEHRHGLGEDDFWLVKDGPPEWQELNHQWERRADQLMAEIFRRHGELELAKHSRDPDHARLDHGMRELSGEIPETDEPPMPEDLRDV